MRSITTWLLGGALAASLSWNWKLHQEREGATPCAMDTRCALGDDSLSPEQRARLGELCKNSCSTSDALERRADERQSELLEKLAEPSVDRAAIETLVDEVSELRKRSLSSCVEGILGVRAVLSPEEVRQLLSSCEGGSCPK